MYENLTILVGFILIYSLINGGLERTPFHGAILFAAFGFAAGPLGLNLIKTEIGAEGLSTLAELTLALVLFTDASNAHLNILKKNIRIPKRLLLIGLPLTILLGFGIGCLLFGDLSLIEVALIATMLAPTDAALGKAVVTNPDVPSSIRESLNVESGLNDGICVPVIFIFLALANHTNLNTGTNALALRTVSEAIGIGLSVGCGLTFAVVKLIKLCDDRNWITASWRQLPIPALAVTCFSLAQLLGGSGFIASFAGGLLFGFLEKGRKHKLLLTAEGTGDTLALITWVIFGVLVVGRYIHSLTWQVVLYSLLSLTIIRMLPVFLVLSGVKLQLSEKLFIGWFGPRGLASIVFAVIIIKNQLPGHATIAMTASGTIVLSVILHGLTANPLVKALATRLERERQS